jgi:subtilisin family serine protease
VPAPTIVVIDTGLANLHQPGALRVTDSEDVYPAGSYRVGTILQSTAHEVWDRDADDVIDPMAGHGTFIAGIIKMIAPMCRLRVQGPLTGYGDISEHDLTIVLQRLHERGAPDLLNLSLGGYAVEDMPALAKVVRDLQTAGTVVVASAGNDATCRPTYPAAFRDVIAVGALGAYGPAHFTNYGNWVRACAPGVNVVSTFFDGCRAPGGDEFDGWATWSGTSFAAPAVVGALAHAMLADGGDLSVEERRRKARMRAVHRLIDDPGLFRIPGLGAVVNQTPWWRRRA